MELTLPELEPGGEVAELVMVGGVQGVVGAVPGRVGIHHCCDLFVELLEPVKGEDIQVGIVGTADDVPDVR